MLGRVLAVALMALVALVAMVEGEVSAVRYYPLKKTKAYGHEMFTVKNMTRIQCAILCEVEKKTDSCVGFNAKGARADGGFTCSFLANLTTFASNNEHTFYCADCYVKGEPCSRDEQCVLLTEHTHCTTTNNTCQCQPGYADDEEGCTVIPLMVGDSCRVDAQCEAGAPYSKCDGGICTCPDDMSESQRRCKYDYSNNGFVQEFGRWVEISWPALISWDVAAEYCRGKYATLMRPRTREEYNWLTNLDNQPLGPLLQNHAGNFLPVTDVVMEGRLVWLDGQATLGSSTSLFDWKNGVEGADNSDTKDCAYYWKATNTAQMIKCTVPVIPWFGVVCEADPEAV